MITMVAFTTELGNPNKIGFKNFKIGFNLIYINFKCIYAHIALGRIRGLPWQQ